MMVPHIPLLNVHEVFGHRRVLKLQGTQPSGWNNDDQ